MPLHRLFAPSAALLLLFVLSACGGGGDASRGEDGDEHGERKSASATAQPALGERTYQQRCISCHQANGEGTAGVFPPLVGAEHANAANVGVPIRIVVHGLMGPITVKGTEYNSVMPPYGLGIVMSDAEVAAVLTYIRSSWGNKASAVTEEDVEEEREAMKGHTGAVTAALLKPLMQK